MYNQCYSLAFDVPSASHVTVKVFGHGALLGTLTIRNEERQCFQALFFDSKTTVRHRLRKGSRVDSEQFELVAKEESWIVMEPEHGVCQYHWSSQEGEQKGNQT